jgi:hypothetical protein
MGLCMIMLKHEVMAVDEWPDNGPRDLLTVSLCIPIVNSSNAIVFVVRSLCLLCSYHNCHHRTLDSQHWHQQPLTHTTQTRGVRLWCQSDRLHNSLKRCWRWFMVDKLTFNSLATALVDIPVSIPIAQTWDVSGIVLWDKTAHFRVAFYCSQHKVHLCNDNAV